MGPVDFKIVRGAEDQTLVEFKRARRSHLAKSLEKQVEVYKTTSDAKKVLKVALIVHRPYRSYLSPWTLVLTSSQTPTVLNLH